VTEVEDVPVLAQWQLNTIFDVGEGEALMEALATISGFGEPVDIRAPEGVEAIAFPLELSRPEDAQVYLEDATTLAFFTAMAPEEAKTLYTDALVADGWTVGESRQETAEGRSIDVLPFSRGEEQLEIAIAATGTQTLVAFTLQAAEE
jgi:hypothetical protein